MTHQPIHPNDPVSVACAAVRNSPAWGYTPPPQPRIRDDWDADGTATADDQVNTPPAPVKVTGTLCQKPGCTRYRKHVNTSSARQFIYCRTHLAEARTAGQAVPEVDLSATKGQAF